MINTTRMNDRLRLSRSGTLSPNAIQRVESGLIVALAMIATIRIDSGLWWFPLALFLVFDLSTLGYLDSPAVGAFWYNAIHTYVWPAVLAVVALLVRESTPSLSTWVVMVALAWAFHVGVDRMLGYGLKMQDGFTSTHLGQIGRVGASTGEDK